MNTTAKEKIKDKKHLKLLKAHDNNIKISDMNLDDKYSKFEDSKLNESETLLFEIENKPKVFKRYFRGEIVRVKFGVNIGSEFSGDHFAIVVSKNDTMMSPTLHVIPLTSKRHLKSVSVGNILYNKNEIKKLNIKFENETNNSSKKKILSIIKYYEQRKNVVTYASIDHIKTISKLSINKTLFKDYDYLPNIKCNDELMKKIDNSIVREYTNL